MSEQGGMAGVENSHAQSQAISRGTNGENEKAIPIQPQDDDIVIAVMGVTGAWKSTFISLVSEQSIEIGHGLDSQTANVKIYSFRHSTGRIGYLIDTPGFDDTTRSDSEILKEIAYFLANLHYKSKKLSGLIYLHRIMDPKMGGSAVGRTTPRKWRISVGERREAELINNDRFWGTMVKGGSRVARHNGTAHSAQAILSQMIDQKKVVLEIQRQIVDDNLPLAKTMAGEFLEQEFREARKQQEEELRELKESMEAAKKEKDQEMVELLLAQQRTCEDRLRLADTDQQKLKVNFHVLEQEQGPHYQAQIEQLRRENPREAMVDAQASNMKFLEQSLADLQDEFERKEKEHRAQMIKMRREVKAQSAQEQQQIQKIIAERDQWWQNESMRMMAQIRAERLAGEDREREARMRMSRSGGSGNPILDFPSSMFSFRR